MPASPPALRSADADGRACARRRIAVAVRWATRRRRRHLRGSVDERLLVGRLGLVPIGGTPIAAPCMLWCVPRSLCSLPHRCASEAPAAAHCITSLRACPTAAYPRELPRARSADSAEGPLNAVKRRHRRSHAAEDGFGVHRNPRCALRRVRVDDDRVRQRHRAQERIDLRCSEYTVATVHAVSRLTQPAGPARISAEPRAARAAQEPCCGAAWLAQHLLGGVARRIRGFGAAQRSL